MATITPLTIEEVKALNVLEDKTTKELLYNSVEPLKDVIKETLGEKYSLPEEITLTEEGEFVFVHVKFRKTNFVK